MPKSRLDAVAGVPSREHGTTRCGMRSLHDVHSARTHRLGEVTTETGSPATILAQLRSLYSQDQGLYDGDQGDESLRDGGAPGTPWCSTQIERIQRIRFVAGVGLGVHGSHRGLLGGEKAKTCW